MTFCTIFYIKKPYRILRLVLIIFFVTVTKALVSNPTDSLQLLVNTSPYDSIKVEALLAMAENEKEFSFLQTINDALGLAQRIDFKKGIAAGHMALGKYHYHKENFSISLLHCITAFNIAKATGNIQIMAKACLYIGYNNFLSQPDVSLKYYFKCVEYCRSANCQKIAAYGYSAIGNVYESRDDAAVALRYYNMSLQIRKKTGTPAELVSSLIETARAFNRLQDYQKSTELINEALNIAEKNTGNEQNLVYLYEMTGHDIAGRLNDYDRALGYFLKSYEVAKNNNLSQTNSVKPIAEMYLKLGDYKNSAYYFKVYNDLLELNQRNRLKEILKADDVIKRELDNEREIVKAKEKELVELGLQKQRIYRNMYIAGIFVLIAFLFFIYRNNRLKEKLNRELEQQVKERTYDLESLANQLLLSEKRLMDTNKELESFIYRTSHDLKSPLASSKGLVNLALNSEKADEVWDFVRLIGKSLDKLDWILVTLYEVSVIRKGSVLIKEIDIDSLIKNLFQNLNDVANHNHIKLKVNNNLKQHFLSDEILMQTILRNILENAVKYSQLGISNPFIAITLSQEDNYVIMTVEDNGVGIKADYVDKIFDPFVRANTEKKGSGLGLYIVKNAMDKLGGKIELVRSEPHIGTVFRLQFPNQCTT